MNADHKIIVENYKSCLEKHGDNHFECDWPNLKDLHTRFRILLYILNFSPRKKINIHYPILVRNSSYVRIPASK